MIVENKVVSMRKNKADKTLFVVMGLPGTGKTEVAKVISEKTGSELLRSDVIRKELFPSPTYSDKETMLTFNELFERAEKYLDQDKNVVLDAVFPKKRNRDRSEKIAEAHGAKHAFILVTAPEELIKERLDARTADESDADFKIYKLIEKNFAPLEKEHVIIENNGSLEDLGDKVEKILVK